MTKDYRIELRVKNNLLYTVIRDAGFDTVRAFTTAARLSYTMTCQLITMKLSPVQKITSTKKKHTKPFIDLVYKICKALDKDPEDLFAQCHIDYVGKSTVIAEIDSKDVDAYLEMTRRAELDHQTPDDEIFKAQAPALIEEQLATLTPREAEIVRMRFGIGLRTDYTLEDVGKRFGLTRDRIRQIEAKALRKLRHPARSGKLLPLLDGKIYDETKRRIEREEREERDRAEWLKQSLQ